MGQEPNTGGTWEGLILGLDGLPWLPHPRLTRMTEPGWSAVSGPRVRPECHSGLWAEGGAWSTQLALGLQEKWAEASQWRLEAPGSRAMACLVPSPALEVCVPRPTHPSAQTQDLTGPDLLPWTH